MTTTGSPARPARRLRGALATSLGLLLVATACGGSEPGGGGGAAAEYTPPGDDLEASLTYSVWDQTQVDSIEANIAAFQEQHPGVEVSVDVTPFGEYWTKLQTQASSGTLPDLFWMNGPNVQLYASNDLLAPLDGAVEAGDVDPANYPESLIDLYTYDDALYGVPKDFDTIAIWANRAIFEQAGVEVPEGDWTWEEFQATAAEISQALEAEGIYGAAGGMDGQTTYYDTIYQAGGSVIEDGESAYDTPEAQAGIDFWRELIESGGSPTMAQLTDTTADQWFTSGRLGMYWGGSWFRAALTDTPVAEDVVVLPLPTGEEQATVIHGVANVVAASSDQQQAAQALQVFLAGEEAQRQLGEAGSVIPAYTGTQDTFTESMPDADLQVFLDALDYAQPLPVSESTAEWNALEVELLPQAFSGAEPVEEVTTELAQQMDAVLAEG
ncbi:sugar ABC transporter substrate-binding protein [uncultured Pseudokineococcus sp.]|uniref:ABC transporter substrate-binding protein n=1 Tax=uncultured Pseudokineococcus sp. TaxID=1642928 RepID=UPI00262E777E|nr:sugar ABC transporter substrate-binding protein [uncultured Pseudokineococcus sp.]